MDIEAKQTYIGRKIWYGLAIALCMLVILMCMAAIAGTWVVGSQLSAVTMQVLLVVENTADGLSSTVERIDMQVARLEETSTEISDATSQLSQDVNDKGMILTLLPEEREQELAAQRAELQENLNAVIESLEAGLALYQSIDNLPFVSLPKPEAQTVSNLEQSITDVQDTIEEVLTGIQEFRTGVSEEIGKVTGLLDDITTRLTEARQNLEQLNSSFKALQDLMARLRSRVTLIFTSISIIVTLLLVWLIFTQVEIIRLFIQRWKGLSDLAVITLPEEEPAITDSPGT